jgi:phosphate transport system protein
VTVAKLTKLVADADPDRALNEVLVEMGDRAEEMLRRALDAFANRDLAAAESLVELDDMIDRANRRFVERLVDLMAQPELREWGLRMVVAARTLERIGDRAVDIGEQVAYLLTAEFREFSDASHPVNP